MSAFEQIELTPDEEARNKKYCVSFGDKWAERDRRQIQARTYVRMHLQKIADESKQWVAGRCWNKAIEVYRRQDGQPFTQDDYDAVDALDDGQVNYIQKGTVGSLKIERYWECDSSD